MRVAKAAVVGGGRLAPKTVLLVYAAAVLDVAIWTPVFTGAAVLWGWLAVVQWQKPMLLLVIVPLWLAAAMPPARWALQAARGAIE